MHSHKKENRCVEHYTEAYVTMLFLAESVAATVPT